MGEQTDKESRTLNTWKKKKTKNPEKPQLEENASGIRTVSTKLKGNKFLCNKRTYTFWSLECSLNIMDCLAMWSAPSQGKGQR